jgi:hypothetical protein
VVFGSDGAGPGRGSGDGSGDGGSGDDDGLTSLYRSPALDAGIVAFLQQQRHQMR